MATALSASLRSMARSLLAASNEMAEKVVVVVAEKAVAALSIEEKEKLLMSRTVDEFAVKKVVAETDRDMIERVGSDNIFIHLDTYHMNIEEDGMVEGVLAAGDRLGYVHVGESHRGYLGTGNVDFDAFFGALKQINYTGPIAFESFSSAVVDPALSDALRIWRNLWTDSDDLATKALAFMKERY